MDLESLPEHLFRFRQDSLSDQSGDSRTHNLLSVILSRGTGSYMGCTLLMGLLGLRGVLDS